MAFTAGRFCLVQIVGSRNKAVLGPRAPLLHLTRYLGVPIRSELDRFSPYTRSVPLVGREHEMSELQRFLQDPRPIRYNLALFLTPIDPRQALLIALESAEIYRQLAAQLPQKYQRDLDDAKNLVAYCRKNAGPSG